MLEKLSRTTFISAVLSVALLILPLPVFAARPTAPNHGAWFESILVGGYLSNIQDGVYIKVEYTPDADTINDDFIRHNPDETVFWHRTQIETNVTVYIDFEEVYWGTANVIWIAPDRPIYKSNPIGPTQMIIIGKVNDNEGNVYNLEGKVVINANNKIVHWYIKLS